MAENIIGNKYSRLLVVNQYYKHDGKRNRLYCFCICDCGETVEVRYDGVTSGETNSCGCYHIDVVRNTNTYSIVDNYVIGITNNTDKEFYFDLDEYDKVNEIGWSENDKGYIIGRRGDDQVKLHRLIMGFPELKIDHADRNKRNNLKENLRVATNIESARNRGLFKTNSSGVTGVSFHIEKQKYMSYLYIDGQNIYLGYYHKLEDAIVARLICEKERFGEFAPQKHLFQEYNI